MWKMPAKSPNEEPIKTEKESASILKNSFKIEIYEFQH
jgi:hypothetical protein